MLKNKTLLITGGTGSFGNAVLNRLLKEDVAQVRIFSRDEKKQDDMRRIYRNPKLRFYVGDVRSPESIASAMKGVDYVFSAAALKQVPSCEFFPMEAVRTNVEGTYNTLKAASDCGVKTVICLSTDKAVYPINAMGMSKAMMEKVMIAESKNDSNTVMCATRYGNVMCSRGSVIPLFIEQLKNKRPLTVTDPHMTRFLMSLEDSVDLVIYAFKNAKHGDIFVQKSPASTIGDLAQALKELFDVDVPIKIIGTRHGEKRYESLLTREEMATAKDTGRYYRIPADVRGLDYEMYFNEGKKTMPDKEYNSDNTIRLGIAEIKELLLTLPEIRNELGL
ncbi:MAG: polysaccharide biosynthesis protein [Oscillospiraceae bacterium]|nr:polysaccharide biosynthesis protein [Oscillospiraceae bacterium]